MPKHALTSAPWGGAPPMYRLSSASQRKWAALCSHTEKKWESRQQCPWGSSSLPPH